MTGESFLRELKQGKEIAVFGTGYIAGVLLRALEAHGAAEAVRLFLVSECGEGAVFHGRPVITPPAFREQARDLPVFLAVHEAVLGEVRELLGAQGISAEWISPLLPELLYGRPLESTAVLPVKEVLERQDPKQYWLAARACGVRGILEDRPEDLLLYRKAITLFSSRGTAEKRLELLRELIAAVQAEGFDPERPILMDEDFRLIDGLHRLALAKLLGRETVHCRIYRRSPLYDEVMDERTVLRENLLREPYFTPEETGILKDFREQLLGTRVLPGEEEGPEQPEISLILPVYNVAPYIDFCMESILAQTFPDFEALLIDDGSTDGSSAACDAWAAQDSRIRVIHQENGGVSSARNRGIGEARGEWLAFVDPDDWLDPRYLEKLRRAALEAGADFAECDVWRCSDRTGKKSYRSCGGTMGVPWTLEEHMKYGSTASYKAISRRDLWISRNIRFPDCAFESPAVYSLVLASAKKIVNIPEPLYYYRIGRPASLIETGYAGKDGSPNNTLGTEAMAHLMGEFRRLGLYERYRETLEGIVKYRLSDILATQFYRKSPADYRETVTNFRAFLEKTWPGRGSRPYVVFGGYNLNRILVHLKLLQDPYCRFNFSSLVSLCAQDAPAEPVRHENRYREMMLQREEDCALWEILREVRPAYFFVDLIEERFDLLERDGRIVTWSDAREEALGDDAGKGRRISRRSRECTELFRKSCGIFARKLREAAPDMGIVIVENYLCRTVGDLSGRRPYENEEEIREMNSILQECYAALEEACPEALRVAPREDPALAELLFTDEKYGHGAVPSHLNELANRQIAARIEALLEGGEG